jgi:hypothetical protein
MASGAGASVCPSISFDGTLERMRERVGPGVVGPRGGTDRAAGQKPAAFPVTVCEAPIPRGTVVARIGDRQLARVKAIPDRIVVIGDTGCRLAANLWQDCSSSSAWPFATLAGAAAAEHPDLVVHVGDYHYREAPCPPDRPGCANSPWGYGWDAWKADLFSPAAPLMDEAPWLVVRGNHEECARAGQGWFRLLDPAPFLAERSCDLPALDKDANYSEPYAVPIAGDSQFVIFDSSVAGNDALDPTKAKDAHTLSVYERQVRAMADLSATRSATIFLSHHPVLAFAPSTASTVFTGNPALQAALRSVNGTGYFPAGVQAAISGHVHLFQALSFSSGHPPSIVAGNGGDELDRALPSPLPVNVHPAPGVNVESFDFAGTFGYLVMDHVPGGWLIRAKKADRTTLRDCLLIGKELSCRSGPAHQGDD